MGHRNHRCKTSRKGAIYRVFALSLAFLVNLAPQTPAQERNAPPRAIPLRPSDPPTGVAVPFDPPTAPAVPANPPPSSGGDSGEIRIAPQNAGVTPDQAQFDVANGFYSRKMYEMAAQEFETYLENYPSGADRQAALYRTAESYWNLKKTKAARDRYENLIIEYQNGEFVGNAAFRLGDIYLADQNFKAAIPMFEKAAALSKDPKITAAALYNLARAMESAGRKNDTVSVYQQIVTIGGNNPYREISRRALAARYIDLGRTADALKQYDALSKESEDGEVRAEACVRAATLAAKLQQPEKAAAYYMAAAKTTNGGKWRGLGVVGLLETNHAAGKYKTVVSTFTELQGAIPAEVMPSALILVADSQKELKQLEAAVRTFDRIIREYPKSPEKEDAALRRLDCLNELQSPNLAEEIDKYAAANPGSESALRALRLKADFLLQKERYDEAAATYLDLANSKADPKFRAEALFKAGVSLASAQKLEKAVEIYSRFLEEFKTHSLTPSVYVQRGLAYEKLDKLDAALADFDSVAANFRDSKERELAMRHKALLYRQKQDLAQMSTAFQALLKEYPDSPAAGLANYGIGTAEFEKKNYTGAIPYLEKARATDKEYYANSSFRIILCYFFLQDKAKLAKEIDIYVTAKATPLIPSEVTGWLGETLASEGKSTDAAKYLRMAAAGKPSAQTYLALGRSELKMSNAKAAVTAMENYLKITNNPKERAEGLLLLGEAQIGTKAYAEAKASAEAALALQPEGRLNAEGRMLQGSAEFAAGQYDAAAQSFIGVAALFDDPTITPKALTKAAEAYSKAGKPEEARKLRVELAQRFPGVR